MLLNIRKLQKYGCHKGKKFTELVYWEISEKTEKCRTEKNAEQRKNKSRK